MWVGNVTFRKLKFLPWGTLYRNRRHLNDADVFGILMQLMPGHHFLKQNWAFSEDSIFEVTVVLFQEHQIKIVLQTLAASILLEVWDLLQDSYDIVASLLTSNYQRWHDWLPAKLEGRNLEHQPKVFFDSQWGFNWQYLWNVGEFRGVFRSTRVAWCNEGCELEKNPWLSGYLQIDFSWKTSKRWTSVASWWQLKYFLFLPRKLGKIPILTISFFNWVGSTTNICRAFLGKISKRKTCWADTHPKATPFPTGSRVDFWRWVGGEVFPVSTQKCLTHLSWYG